MNLVIFGLFLEVIGVLILTLTAIISYPHQRINCNRWYKRYWWHCWRPVYRNTKTLKWKFKWNRIVIKYGLIPPKHKLHIGGALLLIIGVISQIYNYYFLI
jgi:hypothetical protein